MTTAIVRVGYEYTDCRDILWDTQTTKLSGNDMSISEVGGWNLDIHHRYNFHEGIKKSLTSCDTFSFFPNKKDNNYNRRYKI